MLCVALMLIFCDFDIGVVWGPKFDVFCDNDIDVMRYVNVLLMLYVVSMLF